MSSALRVEYLPLETLTPSARNARLHDDAQVAQIAASIRAFGFCNPVLLDSDTGIIAGHGRVLGARTLGMTAVPCIRLGHLSDAQRRAYMIADNRLAEIGGGWDETLLAQELDALRFEGFDIDLTGFDEAALDAMLADPEAGDGSADIDPDDTPALSELPITRSGDVWVLGTHRLVCGDATDQVVVTRALGGAVPLLMVTDPPYGVAYDATRRRPAQSPGSTPAVGAVLNDDRADWRAAWALFPGDIAYVWHAMRTAQTVAGSLLACDFEIRAEIIWAKDRLVISQGHYHPQHEAAFYAVRKGATAQWCGDRTQTTLWEIPKPPKSETGHSTQKPVACMARPIRNHGAPGCTVYDPFGGSGTTLIACEQTDRQCRMIELNPAYVDVAVRRWQDLTGESAVLEATGEPFPSS